MPGFARYTLGSLLAVVTLAAAASARSATVEHDMVKDGALEIDVLSLTEPTVYAIRSGRRVTRLEVTPDGRVTFLEGGSVDSVSVRGANGDSAKFKTSRHDRVAVWPVLHLSLSGGPTGIFVNLGGASWAFAVSAERSGRGGLAIEAGGGEATISGGERLDVDREGGKVVFRKIGAKWPGVVMITSQDRLAAGGAAAEQKTIKLEGNESFKLDVMSVERTTDYTITRGDQSVTIRVTPGGVVSFLDTSVHGSVQITGTDGDSARFRVGHGDQVSIWPMRELSLSMGPTGFYTRAGGADWTFAIQADATRSEGLRLLAGEEDAQLLAGQRLDLDREGGESIFRRIGQDWEQLALVDDDTIFVAGRRPTDTTSADSYTATGGMSTLPFLHTGWAAWEIRPSVTVSP